MISELASTAETGYAPPESAFPSTRMSGWTWSCSHAVRVPVLPHPVWTSSAMKSTSRAAHNALTSRRYPSGGTMTPASPWIGSSMTAAMSSELSLNTSRSASTSPYGTTSKPEQSGPKPSREVGSVEAEIAAIERPQKLPSATTMRARLSGTFLTAYAQRLANLTDVSHASTPEFIGSTRSNPNNRVANSVNSPSWSLWKALDVNANVEACVVRASTIFGWQWPWLTAE
mmetsp:Transcript_18625/g.74376  ORF Transcript_18625/g.74376 Transcript_18625/m.74376 type:complete len:229 (+) Transcript_18625:1550-2236(+)